MSFPIEFKQLKNHPSDVRALSFATSSHEGLFLKLRRMRGAS